eukprot:g3688.t1
MSSDDEFGFTAEGDHSKQFGAYFKVRMAPKRTEKPELLQLIQAGDSSAVRRFLKELGPEEACKEVVVQTDGKEFKRTAVHYAACTGNAAIIQLVLRTPVAQARRALDKHLASLKQRGADIQRFGGAEDSAVFREWARTERARLARDMQLAVEKKHNALLTLRDSQGRTPLFYAAAAGHELATLLRSGRGDLRRPAKLERWQKVLYEGEFEAEVLHARQQRMEVLDAQDDNGYTALHFGAANSNVRALKQLVAAGADKELLSVNEETAAALAPNELARGV